MKIHTLPVPEVDGWHYVVRPVSPATERLVQAAGPDAADAMGTYLWLPVNFLGLNDYRADSRATAGTVTGRPVFFFLNWYDSEALVQGLGDT